MAQQTTVALIDDIDGKKADESVSFALDGANYEIDLNKKNAAALRKALAEFIEFARPVKAASPFQDSARKPRGRAKSPASASHREDLAAIRAWAKEAGISVAERGRISADVKEQYAAAQAG